MKILIAEIIDVVGRSNTTFQFKDQKSGRYGFAETISPVANPTDIFYKQAIILQLHRQSYMLGYDCVSTEDFSEYKAGAGFILKRYQNDNLSIYPISNGALGLSLLNFKPNSRKLEFNSIFFIPLYDLPPNYHVEINGSFTTIESLLPTTKFAALSMIPRNTIIRWKHTKLKPIRITSTGYSFYSIDQLLLAKILFSKRSNSQKIYNTILKQIKCKKSGTILYITYFKSLIQGYNRSHYSTLRAILRKLVEDRDLEHFKKGYYRIP